MAGRGPAAGCPRGPGPAARPRAGGGAAGAAGGGWPSPGAAGPSPGAAGRSRAGPAGRAGRSRAGRAGSTVAGRAGAAGPSLLAPGGAALGPGAGGLRGRPAPDRPHDQDDHEDDQQQQDQGDHPSDQGGLAGDVLHRPVQVRRPRPEPLLQLRPRVVAPTGERATVRGDGDLLDAERQVPPDDRRRPVLFGPGLQRVRVGVVFEGGRAAVVIEIRVADPGLLELAGRLHRAGGQLAAGEQGRRRHQQDQRAPPGRRAVARGRFGHGRSLQRRRSWRSRVTVI